jgi:hypothetical protein
MEDFFSKKLNSPGTKRICHEIQIVFKSDADLKEKTLEKAKTEGVTLKAVLTMAMRAYVNDEMVLGMWRREEFYDDKGDSPPKRKEAVTKKKMLKKKRSRISNIQFPIPNKNPNAKNLKL